MPTFLPAYHYALAHCFGFLQSKLHKAALMVWELLAPVNGKFLPIDVVPGGSVRLTVAQPGKAPAAAAKATPKQNQVGACAESLLSEL
jgi:hypothetical protein